MADLHIEEFYRDAAVILTQLYRTFPRRTSIYVEDIAGADTPDEFGLHSNRHLACFSTMLWLAEEGWIRYIDTIGQLAIDQATLTQRSFILLSGYPRSPSPTRPGNRSTPDLDAENSLRIDWVRSALETGSSNRITRTVRDLLFSR